MLESLRFKSTTQSKGLEQAITFLLKNKLKKIRMDFNNLYT